MTKSCDADLIIRVLELFSLWLRQGIRYQGLSADRQVRELAESLRHHGFLQSAVQLDMMWGNYLVKYWNLPCSMLNPSVLLLAMHQG